MPENFIRLVFMVRLEEGLSDGNCSPLNPYLWASDAASKTVFFTGGVHEETPRCDAGTSENCVPGDVADAAHIELGAWDPNVVQMYDDGTNGDPVAGDGVWTRSFIVPWIPGASENGARGVRIGYKYTYGQPGSLWTDTEEWPGNQRILEVADLDGDNLVIRYDYFGDEATNKDKKNALSFANGGCGTNQWPEKESDTCHSDVFENGKFFQDPCDGSEPPAQPAVAPVSCSEVGN